MRILLKTLSKLTLHRGHQGVEHADGEGGAAGEGLREIELGVGVVVVVLIEELDVGVVHQLCYHGDVSPKY